MSVYEHMSNFYEITCHCKWICVVFTEVKIKLWNISIIFLKESKYMLLVCKCVSIKFAGENIDREGKHNCTLNVFLTHYVRRKKKYCIQTAS